MNMNARIGFRRRNCYPISCLLLHPITGDIISQGTFVSVSPPNEYSSAQLATLTLDLVTPQAGVGLGAVESANVASHEPALASRAFVEEVCGASVRMFEIAGSFVRAVERGVRSVFAAITSVVGNG